MKTIKKTEARPSPELEELLKNTPVWVRQDLQELEKAGHELENDPEFLAEVLKAKFVNEVCGGMEEAKLNKNMLAKKMGCSRQYLTRLLNEEKTVNFTIETMVKLVHVLGKRLELNVVGKNESGSPDRGRIPGYREKLERQKKRILPRNPWKEARDKDVIATAK